MKKIMSRKSGIIRSFMLIIGIINMSSVETAQAQDRLIKLVAGTSVNTYFRFDIDSDYYISANNTGENSLIATHFQIENLPGITTGEIMYRNHCADGNNRLQDTFTDELDVIVPITVSENINRGEYELKGSLIYQPCMNEQCFIPRNYEFKLKVLVL